MKYEESVDSSVACNCYLYIKTNYRSDLPPMKQVVSNVKKEVGDIAVFYYPNSGLYHVAKVIWTDGFNFTITEANFNHCEISRRTLDINYSRLVGFYHFE